MKSLYLLVCLLSALSATAVCAADSYAAPASPSKKSQAGADPLSSARTLIQQQRWQEAITELEALNKTQSADWNNLMGYSQRKAKTPDYAAALQYYGAALRIDPQHRGALEYSGELFLITKDLPAAQARLAMLDNVCGKNCAEYVQLKTAIASYEAGTYPVAAR